jgi:hypothetical protein
MLAAKAVPLVTNAGRDVNEKSNFVVAIQQKSVLVAKKKFEAKLQ